MGRLREGDRVPATRLLIRSRGTPAGPPQAIHGAEATAGSGAARPRLRDCPATVRELRARERALCGLHQLDRALHAFWERLPLRELRIVGMVAVLAVVGYLVALRRGSIEHSLSKVGSAQPGWIAVG